MTANLLVPKIQIQVLEWLCVIRVSSVTLAYPWLKMLHVIWEKLTMRFRFRLPEVWTRTSWSEQQSFNSNIWRAMPTLSICRSSHGFQPQETDLYSSQMFSSQVEETVFQRKMHFFWKNIPDTMSTTSTQLHSSCRDVLEGECLVLQ